MTSRTSTWPGEWNPSRNELDLANERPDVNTLSDFKRALLASDEARSAQRLMHLDLTSKVKRMLSCLALS
jgi:hypothetical protein